MCSTLKSVILNFICILLIIFIFKTFTLDVTLHHNKSTFDNIKSLYNNGSIQVKYMIWRTQMSYTQNPIDIIVSAISNWNLLFDYAILQFRTSR